MATSGQSSGGRRAAIVTGAASGIGAAIAERFVKDGIDVLSVDLRPGPDTPGVPFAADLTTREGNKAAVEAAVERFGRLDIIVPNAGFQHVSPIADFDEDRWDALLAVLLTSPFLLTKYGWPHLVSSGAGRICVIASAHALSASPFKSGYVSGKHGVLGLVKTIALEGADCGVRANAICPGYVRTPLVQAQIADQAKSHGMSEDRVVAEVMLSRQAVKQMVELDDLAEMAVFLTGPHSNSLTGMAVSMDMGWSAL